MFKTERIILFKAKKAGKNNNDVNKKILYKTQAYFARCESQNNKELLQKMLLNPKPHPFRVNNYDSHLFNPTITGRWKFIWCKMEKNILFNENKNKNEKELISEIDNNSGSDNSIKNENNINNNDIIINDTNKYMNISNDNNAFNNNNMQISNDNFMSNIFNQDYFNNNLFFMNYINDITNVNIYNNFSNNIMIQNIHLTNLIPIDNSIINNNSNVFNTIEKK